MSTAPTGARRKGGQCVERGRLHRGERDSIGAAEGTECLLGSRTATPRSGTKNQIEVLLPIVNEVPRLMIDAEPDIARCNMAAQQRSDQQQIEDYAPTGDLGVVIASRMVLPTVPVTIFTSSLASVRTSISGPFIHSPDAPVRRLWEGRTGDVRCRSDGMRAPVSGMVVSVVRSPRSDRPFAIPGEARHLTAMPNWSDGPAVERTPGKVSGAWLFKSTRVPVKALFEDIEVGATVEQFLAWFPGASRDQAEAVLQHALRQEQTVRTHLSRGRRAD